MEAGGLAASLAPHPTPVLGACARELGLGGGRAFLPGITLTLLQLVPKIPLVSCLLEPLLLLPDVLCRIPGAGDGDRRFEVGAGAGGGCGWGGSPWAFLPLPRLRFFFWAPWAEETAAVGTGFAPALSRFPAPPAGVAFLTKGPLFRTMSCCRMSRAAVTFPNVRYVSMASLTKPLAEV